MKKQQQQQQRFTVVLPKHQHEKLTQKKETTGVSIADHIRLALTDYLKEDADG